ncbi:MAG: hypothetical protein K2X39_07020, partial [Silvanigrellaceae bacterium]|nr:hypothetical protein [Silvanigrellaceae bacterium]
MGFKKWPIKFNKESFSYKSFFEFMHTFRKKIFLKKQSSSQIEQHSIEKTHPWYSVLWLTGVDYFSTLAYQPGIALLFIGVLSPFATLLLVFVTLFGAVPVYFQVVKRSFSGQGSIALLEKQLHGWIGKMIVLMLIGFAATDFFITITLSSSDAAAHLTENPFLNPYLSGHNFLVTVLLVLALSLVFLKGFKEAISLAIFSSLPYLILTFIIICFCSIEIYTQPEHLKKWLSSPVFYLDWRGIFILSALAFPKLALGLSGFETGVSVTPLIKNDQTKDNIPVGRILGTKKLLITAALIMSFFLMTSSIVTSILLKKQQVMPGGEAADRALSFLAH